MPQNSCEALQRAVGEFEARVDSYGDGVTRAYVYWISAQAVSLLSGFAAAIIVIAAPDPISGLTKIAIAILSALASFVGTVFAQLRLYELWRLREDMEPKYGLLLAETKRKMARSATEQQCDQVFEELNRDRAASIRKIEIDGFLSFRPQSSINLPHPESIRWGAHVRYMVKADHEEARKQHRLHPALSEHA